MGPGHKLLARFDGIPIVVQAVTAPLVAGFARVVVVTGAAPVEAALAEAGLASRVLCVRNPHWREGLASSLAAGLSASDAPGIDAVVVGLGDMPTVTAQDWLAVAAAGGSPVAVTRWEDGHRSPPARLHRSVWARLPGTGDGGARVLWSVDPDLATEVLRPGPGLDVDTCADLG